LAIASGCVRIEVSIHIVYSILSQSVREASVGDWSSIIGGYRGRRQWLVIPFGDWSSASRAKLKSRDLTSVSIKAADCLTGVQVPVKDILVPSAAKNTLLILCQGQDGHGVRVLLQAMNSFTFVVPNTL
jgi:hypothetical protein